MATAFTETLTQYLPGFRFSDSALQADEQFQPQMDKIAPSDFGPIAETAANNVVPIGEARAGLTFKHNLEQWLSDSEFDSLPDRMRDHESYRAIVGRGERVLPFIFSELKREPSFLFIALEDITGEDPVPEEARGDLMAVTDAWLKWLQS